MTDQRASNPHFPVDPAVRDPEPGGEHTVSGETPGSVPPPNDDEAASALTDAQRELDQQRDKLLRLAAEFDNFRKRTIRERQEAGFRAQGEMVAGMAEALDDLARFAHVDPASTDAATVVEGVAMVERKMLKTLAGHGLEIVDPAGHPFDPALHEAVSTVPAALPEEDHLVAQVFQRGLVFHGQLLRPARVVVRLWDGSASSAD
ncbi:MAG TPA: nucleotide exchange factor GrpE [Gemmatimonadaceae bacterium]|nr:nucleotide exchange factor GrpE [Gemmatimonadaceae bacterium]